MSYKCNICQLKISHDELWEFECGQCTMEDWTNLDKSVNRPRFTQEQKDKFIEGLEVFADLVERMEKLKKEEDEDLRKLFYG